ncbi:MAG: FtsK/SpoIIIE domain-containing protein [Leucobacter sp.]
MKIRVTLVLPRQEPQDITLRCDVTATVGDAARALILAGVTRDHELEHMAEHRLAPVTLRGCADRLSPTVLLDPAVSVAHAGLQSGWTVQPVAEFGRGRKDERVIQAAGYVEVLTGHQAGASYSLIRGNNLIGRETSARVYLGDRSVSRRHAVIEISDAIVLRDNGSANGIVSDGESGTTFRVDTPRTFTLGEIRIRITPGPPAARSVDLSHRIMFTRTPRVAAVFPSTERELPAPPPPTERRRIPLLAMLAPMMLGGAMYVITRSPMSLMMIAFSPLMMIGSWVDSTLGARRRHRRDLEAFMVTLGHERAELAGLGVQEVQVRSQETPTLHEIEAAIMGRGELLWTRRPEHRSFLEVRLGEGTLRSRTRLVLPPRGEATREHWDELRAVAREFQQITPLPLIERLERCGSIGVAGHTPWVHNMARSLIVQLVGLHSPTELILACFAAPKHHAQWGWLKWLPHADPIASPLSASQLADSEESATSLILSLEELLAARGHSSGGDTSAPHSVRSHLDADTRNDDDSGVAIEKMSHIPAVIVLVLDTGFVDLARLIRVAENGPGVGVHVIWVANERAQIPAACRTFMVLGRADGQAHFVRTSTVMDLEDTEWIDDTQAFDLARKLAPVEDTAARTLDESDLPGSVHLREILDTDILGGAGAITQSWTTSDTIASKWNLGHEREPASLAAVVGQGADGRVVIDLRAQGPHALVGGTTGAGKSEFLQSWIMSLAAKVSPDQLTFLLVDYKGGAAFAECVDLPHTVGLVTDLTSHLVRRALASLRAELRYREQLLADHCAKDVISMERRSDAAAPPTLVIVIDEFAALAAEVPEFVDGVIDIAQRGRSLGLHLILATQRPAGVITDNLRANTNLRIALRMADEHDSTDVIGVTDAAFFDAETPGRGAIKVGPGQVVHFQTGYLGGRVSERPAEPEVEIRSLGFSEGAPWFGPKEQLPRERHGNEKRDGRKRDIEQLRDSIMLAAKLNEVPSPRRPWLDELPSVVTLTHIASEGSPGDTAVVGLRDDPAAQSQLPVSIDLEEVGNLALFGAGGSGKTNALLTIAASFSARSQQFPVHIYAIDAAGGVLEALRCLPTVGAVARLNDTELTTRVLRNMIDTITERGPRYAAARVNSLGEYRAIQGNHDEPRLILLLDGFSGFRQATEMIGGSDSPLQLLSEIMLLGRAVGVHVIITGDRPTALPSTMASNVQQRFVFRLANEHDYGFLDVKSDILPDAPPGRAVLVGDEREIQFARLNSHAEFARQAEELERLSTSLADRGVRQVPEIVHAPEFISLSELSPQVGDRPTYGINTRSFTPVGLPLSGLGVIAGPPGSGKSTAALAFVEAYSRWVAARDETLESVLLSFATGGLGESRAWDRMATVEDDVAQLAAELTVALGGTRGSMHALEANALPPMFPRTSTRGVIVVEQPAAAQSSTALAELIALVKISRRAGILMLVEYEQGAAHAAWELFSALKQPSWGVSLQPDSGDSQSPFRESFGSVKRSDFPPGRGFCAQAGHVTPVHIAVPDNYSLGTVGYSQELTPPGGKTSE